MAATKTTEAKSAAAGRPARTRVRSAAKPDGKKEYGTMEEPDAFLDCLNARADALLADIRRISRCGSK